MDDLRILLIHVDVKYVKATTWGENVDFQT